MKTSPGQLLSEALNSGLKPFKKRLSAEEEAHYRATHFWVNQFLKIFYRRFFNLHLKYVYWRPLRSRRSKRATPF